MMHLCRRFVPALALAHAFLGLALLTLSGCGGSDSAPGELSPANQQNVQDENASAQTKEGG